MNFAVSSAMYCLVTTGFEVLFMPWYFWREFITLKQEGERKKQ